MKFKYNDLMLDGKKFMIKYLIEVEDYELEISQGKITIGVFYFPEYPMSLEDAEGVLKNHLERLLREVYAVTNAHDNFYKDFEPDAKFIGMGSTGGRVMGEPVAEYAVTTLTLKQRVAI